MFFVKPQHDMTLRLNHSASTTQITSCNTWPHNITLYHRQKSFLTDKYFPCTHVLILLMFYWCNNPGLVRKVIGKCKNHSLISASADSDNACRTAPCHFRTDRSVFTRFKHAQEAAHPFSYDWCA